MDPRRGAPSGRRHRGRMIPLLTAEETRRAEEAYEGALDELMERAGRAVADAVLERFPGRVTVVCGGGTRLRDARASRS